MTKRKKQPKPLTRQEMLIMNVIRSERHLSTEEVIMAKNKIEFDLDQVELEIMMLKARLIKANKNKREQEGKLKGITTVLATR